MTVFICLFERVRKISIRIFSSIFIPFNTRRNSKQSRSIGDNKRIFKIFFEFPLISDSII